MYLLKWGLDMAFAGAVSRILSVREMEALGQHEVAVTTMVSLVVDRNGRYHAYVDECRPAERESVLAGHGVDAGDPCRCLPYAFVITSNPPFVGGNDEDLKALLLRNAAAIAANLNGGNLDLV